MDQSTEAKEVTMISHKEFKEIKNRNASNDISTEEMKEIIIKLIAYAEDLREEVRSTNKTMDELDSELELLYEKYNELEKTHEKLQQEVFQFSGDSLKQKA